ncbi:hypothetical protein EXD76_08715 [BEV proteobacterium]|nr:hypothetical protein [Candidatus Symbiopectobacterium sp. Chty_BC]
MKRWILATKNHAVRLHEKTVHLRVQAFYTKTGLAKQHDSLLFNKATLRLFFVLRLIADVQNPRQLRR